MIPYKWPVATAIPNTPQVRLEIAKAARMLLQDADERLRRRRAEIAAIKQGLVQIAQEFAVFQREAPSLILSELRKYGHNPSEPRVPKGNPDGGRWTRPLLAEGDDPKALSDATLGDMWVSGARYGANEANDRTNDNLTAEQLCQQAYAEGIADIRRNPSLPPEEYLKSRYQLTNALDFCLRLARDSRPISRDGDFVEFFAAGVVIFKPDQAPRYVRWLHSND